MLGRGPRITECEIRRGPRRFPRVMHTDIQAPKHTHVYTSSPATKGQENTPRTCINVRFTTRFNRQAAGNHPNDILRRHNHRLVRIDSLASRRSCISGKPQDQRLRPELTARPACIMRSAQTAPGWRLATPPRRSIGHRRGLPQRVRATAGIIGQLQTHL